MERRYVMISHYFDFIIKVKITKKQRNILFVKEVNIEISIECLIIQKEGSIYSWLLLAPVFLWNSLAFIGHTISLFFHIYLDEINSLPVIPNTSQRVNAD